MIIVRAYHGSWMEKGSRFENHCRGGGRADCTLICTLVDAIDVSSCDCWTTTPLGLARLEPLAVVRVLLAEPNYTRSRTSVMGVTRLLVLFRLLPILHDGSVSPQFVDDFSCLFPPLYGTTNFLNNYVEQPPFCVRRSPRVELGKFQKDTSHGHERAGTT